MRSAARRIRVDSVDPAAVVAVARFGATVEVDEEARRHVEGISSGDRAVYGVNTGFGALANTRIAESGEAVTAAWETIREGRAARRQP